MASLYTPNRVRELTKEREEGIRAAVASMYGPPEDPLGQLAKAYAGWGGPSPATPEIGGWDPGGWDRGIGIDGGGGGGGGQAGDVGAGEGDPGDPSGYARGGVARAITGPKRMVIGEAGPEFAIAVPLEMLQPGLQGREEEVRKMLHAAMLALGAMGRP